MNWKFNPLLPPYSLLLSYNVSMTKPDKKARGILWVAIAIVFAVSFYLVVVLGVWFAYGGKIRPGVTVAGIQVSGKTDSEVTKILEDKTAEYLANEPALAGYGIKYDLDVTIKEARGAIDSPFMLGRVVDVPLQFSYDNEALLKDLSKAEQKQGQAVRNPYIKGSGDRLAVEAGSSGKRIPYGGNVHTLQALVGNLRPGFVITATDILPVFSEAELRANLRVAETVAAQGLTLSYGTQKFAVDSATIAPWVRLGSDNPPLAAKFPESFLVVIIWGSEKSAGFYDSSAIERYLGEIAKKIDRDPVNATLTFRDGKIDVFKVSKTGLSLNLSENVVNIIEALEIKETEVALKVDEIEPEITKNSLSELGIVGLISEGRSNFAGSPANRRHNIRVGATKFNGLLIKPGETFSFTKNLGAVDASTGYLPELVIKDNETIPEYGGGLCQVSSTTFRAALNAGLPIVARRPHAYPVTYYKPYGTDATIYIPNPDLKFTNDTGHHILIQTRIVGNYLYFDFYGTKKNISLKFAGNKEGTGAVTRVENVRPYIYDVGVRGEGSFTAVFWYFIYDGSGKLIKTDDFVSKYDSPLKYPH